MIILPSRRRPEHLKRFFQSYIESESSEPGLVIIGYDDWHDLNLTYAEIPLPHGWDFEVSMFESMGDKIRHIWPKFAKEEWASLILLNDDHVLETPAWDKKLIAQLNGRNFITCNDMWQPTRAAGATIWSRDLLLAVGYIFPPGMQHLFIDDVWQDLGRETGCWINDQSVIVHHVHAFRTGIEDETHRIGYSNWAHDEAIYNIWKNTEKPEAIKRIMELKTNK